MVREGYSSWLESYEAFEVKRPGSRGRGDGFPPPETTALSCLSMTTLGMRNRGRTVPPAVPWPPSGDVKLRPQMSRRPLPTRRRERGAPGRTRGQEARPGGRPWSRDWKGAPEGGGAAARGSCERHLKKSFPSGAAAAAATSPERLGHGRRRPPG